MKRISNYCKSDRVACFDCQNPGMGEIGIKNHEYLIAIILFRILMGDRECLEFLRPIILAISVPILVFL